MIELLKGCLFLIKLRLTNKLRIVGLNIGYFFALNCYSLLFSLGFLFALLVLFWKINEKYLQNKPFVAVGRFF